MNDTQALKIFESCVNEMYKNSIPPTTWCQIKKTYGGTTKSFVDKHLITLKEYRRIRDKYEDKLPKAYKRKLAWFLLDYSPSLKEYEI